MFGGFAFGSNYFAQPGEDATGVRIWKLSGRTADFTNETDGQSATESTVVFAYRQTERTVSFED